MGVKGGWDVRGRGVRGENGIHRGREQYCRGTVWREG